ncbi:MAG: phosphoglycerate kinase [Flavobacteriales bacterium]
MNRINSYDFNSKRAIVRVDFNVPLDKTSNLVQDDTRIRAAIPTIKHILSHGGSVVLLSHFGRPKNGPEEKFSLRQIVPVVSNLLSCTVSFCEDFQDAPSQANALLPGEVLLIENVRFHPGETKGDAEFAALLASLGNCYVNDAFGSAHRAHSSTTQIASFFPSDRMMGVLMEAEIQNAQRILKTPTRPFVAIVGGAKVSDKVLIIENLLHIATDIIIGGGMAYTFAKAQGGEIGNSLFEADRIAVVLDIFRKANELGVTIHLPVDSVVADSFTEDAQTQIVDTHQIPNGWMGLDIGPLSIQRFKEVILSSKTILWNGPLGVFEWNAFAQGTKEIALSVSQATDKGAFSLVGGGDSAAAISKFGLVQKVSYISTGGGALLELFEGKILPGIQALN